MPQLNKYKYLFCLLQQSKGVAELFSFALKNNGNGIKHNF